MKRSVFSFLCCALISVSCFAQAPYRNKYGPLVQGNTVNIPNIAGSQATSFEYVFTGGPASVSITIQGCMRGQDGQPGQVGTCDAAADTYVGTTNSIRNPSFTKVYDTFLITIGTLSAGSSVVINSTIVVSKAGTGSSGSGGGVSTVTASGPITSSGGANPNIACPTCTTNTVNGTTNVVAKFTSANNIGNSSITDNGTNVVMTEGINGFNGTKSNPFIAGATQTNSGLYFNTVVGNTFSVAGADVLYVSPLSVTILPTGGYAFGASSSYSAGSFTGGVINAQITSPSARLLSLDSTSVGDSQSTVRAAGYLSQGTTFTASGCANSTLVGGATAGTYTSVTGGSCTVTITMGSSSTAVHGWVCDAHDLTTAVDANNVTMGSSTTTTANLVEGTVLANDVIAFKCMGY
jgi:hypothetical protein